MTQHTTSLQTLLDALGVDLAEDTQSPRPTRSLRARRSPLASPEQQLALLDALALGDDGGRRLSFEATLKQGGAGRLAAGALEVFQINLGKLCNMTCRHCHVDAGPDRTDAMMDERTVDACLDALAKTGASTVDLTGGAPELHPSFARIVEAATDLGRHVIDRCNLTVLLLPRFRELPAWLGERGVEVVASLPHYRSRNTDAQRGGGTFERSIRALRLLNDAGYGQGDPRRRLTLMSNPAGAFLAGDQRQLEATWKASLEREHGVTFDRLFALNNMPIARFLEWLVQSDNLEGYMQRLVKGFNPAAVGGLMCRSTLSISWDGRLFDCDFNQMLDLEADCAAPGARHATIHDLDLERLEARTIRTRRHCYGCTAGAGSSCGGATA